MHAGSAGCLPFGCVTLGFAQYSGGELLGQLLALGGICGSGIVVVHGNGHGIWDAVGDFGVLD